jgi:hypothetical protein
LSKAPQSVTARIFFSRGVMGASLEWSIFMDVIYIESIIDEFFDFIIKLEKKIGRDGDGSIFLSYVEFIH